MLQVRAAIREMRRQVLPAPDVGALYQQLLAAALKLAETSKDDKTRLGALQGAGATLEKIRKLKEAARTAEEARKTQAARKPAEGRAEIIRELRLLYVKALPGKAEPSVLEVETEEVIEEERKLEETLAAGDGDVDESAAEFLEEIRAVEAEVPEPPEPQVRYVEKCISKPGHFPPRFVRIAVQTPPALDAS
jgi:hypothetical protein